MNKLEDISRRLAAQQPELKDADDLCNSIMEHLPPQRKSSRIGFRHILQVVTSVAAVLLLVLFIRQTRTIVPPKEDADYRQCLEHVQTDYSQFEDLKPSEALLLFAKIKRERTTLSQLKKNYAL